MDIAPLLPEQMEILRPPLADLLVDAVDSGASVSFLAPLARGAAEGYWDGVGNDVASGSRVVLLAMLDGNVAGCVHLALASQPNSRHRVEIQKLLVHSRYRRRGVATALMMAAEEQARGLRRSLLVLDTEEGSPAESLYAQLGYVRAGVIPHFARSSSGELHGTVFFYKELI